MNAIIARVLNELYTRFRGALIEQSVEIHQLTLRIRFAKRLHRLVHLADLLIPSNLTIVVLIKLKSLDKSS